MSRAELSSSQAQRLSEARFTYSEAGATGRDDLPSGYGHLRRSRSVGAGRGRFEQAAQVLLRWDMHRRAGLRVRAATERVVPDAVAVVRLGAGRLAVSAPVRVVYVVDEPQRQGFAYGTLPGHPESGEEAFVVELHDDGEVVFTITAFSRPATLLARAGGPITRAAQSYMTDRYLRSV